MGARANNVAIVAISYLIALGVEFIDSTPFYYFSFMIIHFTVMFACLKLKGELIKVYGIVNFILMCLYFPYVFGYNYITQHLMWEGWLNFANIILIVELMIIGNGVIHGLLAIFDRWNIDVDGRWMDCFFIDTWTTE